jgi:hypothetical protein
MSTLKRKKGGAAHPNGSPHNPFPQRHRSMHKPGRMEGEQTKPAIRKRPNRRGD